MYPPSTGIADAVTADRPVTGQFAPPPEPSAGRRRLRRALAVVGLSAALGLLSTGVASAAPVSTQVGVQVAAPVNTLGVFGPLKQFCLLCWLAVPAGEPPSDPEAGWHTEEDEAGNQYCVEDGFMDPGPGAPGGPGVRW